MIIEVTLVKVTKYRKSQSFYRTVFLWDGDIYKNLKFSSTNNEEIYVNLIINTNLEENDVMFFKDINFGIYKTYSK